LVATAPTVAPPPEAAELSAGGGFIVADQLLDRLKNKGFSVLSAFRGDSIQLSFQVRREIDPHKPIPAESRRSI
jgi:hypothetical protein